MSTFHLTPYGYCRHESNYDYWITIENNDIKLSDTKSGNIKVTCHVITDDYNNGAAEFLISNLYVNSWVCDYGKVVFDWNHSNGFLMTTKNLTPIAIRKSFSYGIATKDMLKSQLRAFLLSAYPMMKSCNTVKEFIKKQYNL